MRKIEEILNELTDYLKENNSNVKSSYSHGKNKNSNNPYEEYDISFLKRVKPVDKDFNQVLINFTDVKFQIIILIF